MKDVKMPTNGDRTFPLPSERSLPSSLIDDGVVRAIAPPGDTGEMRSQRLNC
jgi:hypothetical protein